MLNLTPQPDGHSHLPGAVYDSDCPEDYPVMRFIEAICKPKEFDIKICGIKSMPLEFLTIYLNSIASFGTTVN
jgi:hypothetical protein